MPVVRNDYRSTRPNAATVRAARASALPRPPRASRPRSEVTETRTERRPANRWRRKLTRDRYGQRTRVLDGEGDHF
ncbi:hypothetical protein GCM10018952_69270 [Streptosporangium vulgare]